MISKTLAPLLVVGLTTLTLIADASTRAADIDDLKGEYSGAAYSSSSTSDEIDLISLTVGPKSANGKFTGEFRNVQVSGKVTPAGKITFSGQATKGDLFLRVKSGKGQLSATGRFIVGSYKVQSNAPEVVTGSFTFSLEESDLSAR